MIGQRKGRKDPMRSGVFISLLAGMCLLTGPATADLAGARAALQRGDFAGAVQEAQTVLPAQAYDKGMIVGRSALELGDYDQAMASVTSAKAARPRDSAAHALEGLILMRQGKRGRAELVLRRALDLAKTPQQKAIAAGLIRQVRNTREWQVEAGLGLAPSTNINKATTADKITVLIPGTDTTTTAIFTGGQAKSGTGLRYYGQARRAISPKFNLHFGLSGTEYKDTSVSSLAGQIGLAFHTDGHHWGLSQVWQGFGGQRFSDTTTLTYRTSKSFTDQNALQFDLSYAAQNRHDDPTKDNTTARAGLTYATLLNPQLRVTAGGYVQQRKSDNAFVAARHMGVTVGADYKLAGTGWQVGAGLDLSFGQWDGIAPLEPEVRRDHSAVLSLKAQNKNISLYGLTPTYGVTMQSRQSNLARHRIESIDLFLGLAHAF